MIIPVVNRTINQTYLDSCDIVVAEDMNSQYLQFRIRRYFDNIDLSTKSIFFRYLTASGYEGSSPAIDIQTTNKTITFTWLLDDMVAKISGNVYFQIEFTGENYNWKTRPAHFNVIPSIAANISGRPSLEVFDARNSSEKAIQYTRSYDPTTLVANWVPNNAGEIDRVYVYTQTQGVSGFEHASKWDDFPQEHEFNLVFYPYLTNFIVKVEVYYKGSSLLKAGIATAYVRYSSIGPIVSLGDTNISSTSIQSSIQSDYPRLSFIGQYWGYSPVFREEDNTLNNLRRVIFVPDDPAYKLTSITYKDNPSQNVPYTVDPYSYHLTLDKWPPSVTFGFKHRAYIVNEPNIEFIVVSERRV